MATNQLEFREELYIEHLEEASFLYEKRLNWLEDDEVGWQELEEIDLAIDAHLDALIVGDQLALQTCLKQIPNADFGVLHTIVRIICRYRLVHQLTNMWGKIDLEDEDKIKAIADALKWEVSKEMLPYLISVFENQQTELYPVVTPALARCDELAQQRLAASLINAQTKDKLTLLENIYSCKHNLTNENYYHLHHYLQDSDKRIVHQTALILIAFNDNTLNECRSRIRQLPYLFALAGNEQDSQMLLNVAQNGEADADILIALGLTGIFTTVFTLIKYLEHPELSDKAALALNLITGANLYVTEHKADDVKEDELFESELDAFKNNELPKNINGLPFGVAVKKLSTNVEEWESWLKANQNKFFPEGCYRNGHFFSASELLNNLINNQMPTKLRQLAYNELILRYQLTIPFYVDDPIYQQQITINKIYQWIEKNKAQNPDGFW
ncbi:hypothetical protein [Aliikangiella maris]|uniref:Uncharacterized protein n=2 Tax=Aliikangiella maris TaxID=3162458 RepID=A0ABV3MNE6_9GAMM